MTESDKAEIEVTGSQHERQDDVEPADPPETETGFDQLKDLSESELESLGLRNWSEDLYLFPGEWFDAIPKGYEVVDINGQTEEFGPEEHSRDIRFGCLAFGIVLRDGDRPSGTEGLEEVSKVNGE